MNDILNNLRKSGKWKIQLTTTIKSSKGTEEEGVMHSNSDSIEITITDEAAGERFESLLFRYQISLEKSMKGSDFSSDYLDLLNYKCYNKKLNCDVLWIDSPNWIKNKNSTVNPFYKYDNKCF